MWRDTQSESGGRAGDEGWVVQVEHIPSGEKRYFSSLEDCFAFIRAQAADSSAKHRDED